MVISCWFSALLAGGLPGFYGARQQAMQGTSSFAPDYIGWANNQSMAALLTLPGAAITFSNHYGLSQINTYCMTALMPTKAGNIGVNAARSGYEKFNEQQIGLAYSRSLWPQLSIGVQFDYFRTYIADIYGKASRMTFEAGVVSRPAKNVSVSMHAFNPARIKRSSNSDEEIPTVFTAGASWNIKNKAILIFETRKELFHPFIFRGGIEYTFLEKFFLRAGVSSENPSFSAGMGFSAQGLDISIAVVTHPVLPVSSQISLQYHFGQNKGR